MTLELVLSPIGLVMHIIGLPGTAGLAAEEVVFTYEKHPQIWGNFFGVCHLAYRIRPPPRPP